MANRVGQQLGNYRLIRLLGQGGFADVYLAEHIYLDTQMAIKVLSMRLTSDSMEQFHTEAQTVARLVHPHIVRVFDFGVEDSTPFLIMDYAPNGTLRQRHPKGTVLPLTTIIIYVHQVADALQYAHDQRLIHRDVKPENMLVAERGDLLLSDFGIALIAQSTHYQNTQEVVGTAAYMAPEQLQGKPRLASDQYALGVVVYEWICGDRPFHGTFTELYSQHLFVPPPPLRERVPTISPEVEQVVLTALEKDPHKRFASVQAFAHALEQASQRPEALGPAPSSDPRPASSSLPKPSTMASLPAGTARTSLGAQEHVSVANVQEDEKVIPPPLSGGRVTSNNDRRGLARRRVALVIGLVFLVVLGSVGLLTFSARNWIITSPRPIATAHPNVLANSNYAMFGFDSQHTHFNASEHLLNLTTVSHLVLYWAASTGNSIDSSPAVANGVVYVGSNDNKLYAFNATTGASLWSYTTGGGISSSPAVANGVVYDGSLDGKLYAVNAKTGAILWTYTTGKYIVSSPVVVDGVVYVGSLDHKLYAFHLLPTKA